jgi:hypothetical protein
MLSVALLAVETPVFAAEVQQASRSAGKLKQDQGIDLAAELEQRELVVKDRPEAPENYAESPTAQRLEGVANRHDQLFEIYDADVQLTADFDGDGYHHALNVVFDVDVSYDAATVYAKLYLSREGEPWSQYFTTDLFDIHGDDVCWSRYTASIMPTWSPAKCSTITTSARTSRSRPFTGTRCMLAHMAE